MIIALKHESMGGSILGDIHENMEDFARTNFKITISDDGEVRIDDELETVAYCMSQYTKEEIFKDYVRTKYFREFAKSRFHSVYQLGNKLI